MFRMDYRICIGGKKLLHLESLEIKKSVDELQDTARLVVPGMMSGVSLNRENTIRRGAEITIEIGYNGELVKEFEGYVSRVSTQGALEIDCEDGMFAFRKDVPNKAFEKPSTTDILNHITSSIGGVKLDASKELQGITFETFLIEYSDGFSVLKKLKEEARIDIYMRGETLCARLPFSEKKGDATYSFQKNIETATVKYLAAQDRKMLVSVTGSDAQGKKVVGVFGEKGGDIINIARPSVSDNNSLQKIAQNIWEKSLVAGYEGEIQTWLIPYATYGTIAKIVDKDYPSRRGSYFVKEVVTTFTNEGGRRTLTLGKKWS